MKYNIAFDGLSASDYPGHLSLVFRFYGCDLECLFCSSNKGEGTLTTQEIMELLDDFSFIANGVVLTGGEPTLHDLMPVVDLIKTHGYDIKLETTGMNPHVVGKLVHSRVLDSVSVSMRDVPGSKLREFVKGLPSNYLHNVEETLRYSRNIDSELVLIIIPGVTDSPDMITKTSLIAKRNNARLILEEFIPERTKLNIKPGGVDLARLGDYSVAETWAKTRKHGYLFLHPERDFFM